MIGGLGGMVPLATLDFFSKVISPTHAQDDTEHRQSMRKVQHHPGQHQGVSKANSKICLAAYKCIEVIPKSKLMRFWPV
jgi:aspartate/glutamate racemase